MAESVKIARVFVKQTKLTDAQCNAIVTSRAVPTTDWVQVYTLGEVRVNYERETLMVGNDQIGMTKVYQLGGKVSITLPMSEQTFDYISRYGLVDPSWSSGATAVDLKENIGVALSGISLLIYSREFDITNETNTPDVTADTETICIFDAVTDANVEIVFSKAQGVLTLTLTGMSNNGSGSARGVKGTIGTFSAA